MNKIGSLCLRKAFWDHQGGGGLQADKLLEGNIWQRLFLPSNKQFLCSVTKGYFKVKINDLFAQW